MQFQRGEPNNAWKIRSNELLEHMLGRITKSIDDLVGARSFFFLAPPFIDRHHREYVDYYGLQNRTEVEGVDRLIYDAIQSVFPSTATAGESVPLKEVCKVIPAIRSKVEQTYGYGDNLFKDVAKAAAFHVLKRSSVDIGRYSISDSGAVKTEFRTLLDFALGFAHSDDKDDYVKKANMQLANVVGNSFRFRSNRSFCKSTQDIPDETLWSTDGYLTWNTYIRSGRDNENGTIEQFLAELIFSLEDLELLGLGEESGIQLGELRQTHLPLAGFGQFRGSLCWVSHLKRDPAKCSSIVCKIDRTFQKLLSEQFSFALLEAFRVCFADAISERGNSRKQYFSALAHAFGLLFWNYEVEFWLGDKCVAKCLHGDVTFDAPLSKPRFPLTQSGAIQWQHTGENIGTTIALNIPKLISICQTGKQTSRYLSEQSAVDALRFDTVVCRGLYVADTDSLVKSEWLIGERVSSVVTDVVANLERMMGLVSHAMGHQIKHVCTERGAQKVASRLENQILRATSKQKNAILLKISRAEEVVSCLRAEESLAGPAEMFRSISTLQMGMFPYEWKNEHTFSMPLRQKLEVTKREVELVIRNLLIDYNRIARKHFRIDGKSPRVGLLVQDLTTGEKFDVPPAARQGIPGLISNSNIDASLAVFCGLHELIRNAFRHTVENGATFFHESKVPTVWYKLEGNENEGYVRASVVNITLNENVRSRSLEVLEEIGRELKCIEIQHPTAIDETPFGGLSNFRYVMGSYTIFPGNFRFDASKQLKSGI